MPVPDRYAGHDTLVRDAEVALHDVPGVGLSMKSITPGHLPRVNEAQRVRKPTGFGSTEPLHVRPEGGTAEGVLWVHTKEAPVEWREAIERSAANRPPAARVLYRIRATPRPAPPPPSP